MNDLTLKGVNEYMKLQGMKVFRKDNLLIIDLDKVNYDKIIKQIKT